MRLRFLGTGTSSGVPQLMCKCEVCTSTDTHDKRSRSSALIQLNDGRNLLIDCGPDFYTQVLHAGCPQLHCALLTHSHYDHVGGIDDLRPYCADHRSFPLYCKSDVARDLRERVPYCFRKHPYPGVPSFDIHEIDSRPFMIDDIEVTPLPVMHLNLPILGFRIGKFAYITDAKTIPDTTVDLLQGVDTLVINALRQKPHISHMSLPESLEIIARVNPRAAYLTHLSHGFGLQAVMASRLPENVHIAYDGLIIDIPD